MGCATLRSETQDTPNLLALPAIVHHLLGLYAGDETVLTFLGLAAQILDLCEQPEAVSVWFELLTVLGCDAGEYLSLVRAEVCHCVSFVRIQTAMICTCGGPVRLVQKTLFWVSRIPGNGRHVLGFWIAGLDMG